MGCAITPHKIRVVCGFYVDSSCVQNGSATKMPHFISTSAVYTLTTQIHVTPVFVRLFALTTFASIHHFLICAP